MKSNFHIFMFSLLILLLIPISSTAGTGDTISEAVIAKIGDNSGILELYNDQYWFNFTSNTNEHYNFSLNLPDESYVTLYLYDQNNNLIDKSTTSLGDRALNATGYAKYLILVAATEFVEYFPYTFTLTISKLDMNNEKDNGNGNFFSNLPIQVLPIILAIPTILLFKKNKF